MIFLLEPRAKKLFLELFLKRNRHCSLSSMTLIQNRQLPLLLLGYTQMCTSYCSVIYYFKFVLAAACVWRSFHVENFRTFYCMVLKSNHVWHLYIKQLMRWVITVFLHIILSKSNEIVVTSYKLNTFAGLATSGHGPDVAQRPPVGPHWHTVSLLLSSCFVCW
jgi:hypothetical protein